MSSVDTSLALAAFSASLTYKSDPKIINPLASETLSKFTSGGGEAAGTGAGGGGEGVSGDEVAFPVEVENADGGAANPLLCFRKFSWPTLEFRSKTALASVDLCPISCLASSFLCTKGKEC